MVFSTPQAANQNKRRIMVGSTPAPYLGTARPGLALRHEIATFRIKPSARSTDTLRDQHNV